MDKLETLDHVCLSASLSPPTPGRRGREGGVPKVLPAVQVPHHGDLSDEVAHFWHRRVHGAAARACALQRRAEVVVLDYYGIGGQLAHERLLVPVLKHPHTCIHTAFTWNNHVTDMLACSVDITTGAPSFCRKTHRSQDQ